MKRVMPPRAKRVLKTGLWIALGFALLLLLETPIRRMLTMVRLYREELRPPLQVPVEGVPRSALRDTWAAARSGGRKHEGVDIFAPCGQPVLSATEGIVVSTGENELGGQVVWVLGPGGSRHYYAHLSRFADIGRGDHVQAGHVLAHVGNTGNAAQTPCHLHYGIYEGGEARNPFPLLMAPAAASDTADLQ